MAIGTPTSAGTSISVGAASSGNITVSVTAGNRLFIVADGATSTSRTISSVSGASLSFAVDKAITQSNGFIEIWSAHCASTVTSQSITVSFSGAILAGAIAAFQVSGVATSSYLDGSGASAGRTTPADQHWTTGAATISNATSMTVACCFGDFLSASSDTATGTVNVELIDFASANDIGLVVNYVLNAAAGSITGTGSWNATAVADASILAAYKEETLVAASGGGIGFTRLGRHRGRYPAREPAWF